MIIIKKEKTMEESSKYHSLTTQNIKINILPSAATAIVSLSIETARIRTNRQSKKSNGAALLWKILSKAIDNLFRVSILLSKKVTEI